MSARDRVHAMLPPLDSPAEAEACAAELDARLDAVRVEDLNEGITRLEEWTVSEELKPGLRFAIGVLKSVRDREPAEQGEPSFYQPGYVYSYPRYADGYDWKFRVDTVTTHPEDGERTALGWRHWKGEWEPYAYDQGDWDIHNFDPAGALIATPVEEVTS